MNCPTKHNHTVIPPEFKNSFHKLRTWKNMMMDTHYEVKCKGCGKYLIYMKKPRHS